MFFSFADYFLRLIRLSIPQLQTSNKLRKKYFIFHPIPHPILSILWYTILHSLLFSHEYKKIQRKSSQINIQIGGTYEYLSRNIKKDD